MKIIAWFLFAGFPLMWCDTNYKQWKTFCTTTSRTALWLALNIAELWAFFYLWTLKP